MPSKKVNEIISTQIFDLVTNKYLELSRKLNSKLVSSFKLDKVSAEDLIHDTFEELLKKKDFVSVEDSVDKAINAFLFSKIKFKAKSYFKPRYQSELSKTNIHFDFVGTDYEKIENKMIDKASINEDKLDALKIKKLLTKSEWKLIDLYFYQNLSFRKIGKKLFLDPKTIKSRLQNVINKIATLTETNGVNAPLAILIQNSINGSATNTKYQQYAV